MVGTLHQLTWISRFASIHSVETLSFCRVNFAFQIKFMLHSLYGLDSSNMWKLEWLNQMLSLQ